MVEHQGLATRKVVSKIISYYWNVRDKGGMMKLKDLGILPEKIIHNHNSIPGYYDSLEDGCCMCLENHLLNQIGEIEVEIDEEKVFSIVRATGSVGGQPLSMSEDIAKALSQGDILKIKGE